MATSAAARSAAIDRQDRRKRVETALHALGRPVGVRRWPPPEGRLGAAEDLGRRLRHLFEEFGPVFASFGRYLATRVDLLPRRTRDEFATLPDRGTPQSLAAVGALVRSQLGAPIDRLFFEFHETPFAITSWTQRHLAWLAPGVPAMVTVVRQDAVRQLDEDMPLLPLVAPWIGLPESVAGAVVADFDLTIRRRLDQRHQASSLTALAADHRGVGGFDAPECYRDHCAANILTTARLVGETVDQRPGSRDVLARRVATAWLRQVLSGSVVPYDFVDSDIVVADDRLVLTSASFTPQSSTDRAHAVAYVGAVAADDPDTASTWIMEGSNPDARTETELRRVLRQAVPFRDGEWSGDDRLAEHILVQWRVAFEAGWVVPPHQQHFFQGLHAVTIITRELAPDVDTLLAAFEDERLRVGASKAGHVLDPRQAVATLDRAIQQLSDLPQKLDDVLTLAAEGRLRMNLRVPEARESEHVRNRTVLLVTVLVAFAAVASIVRHLVPALGLGVERIGALVLLVVGGWLLIAAARL